MGKEMPSGDGSPANEPAQEQRDCIRRWRRRQFLGMACFAGAFALSFDKAAFKPVAETEVSVIPAINKLGSEYGYLKRITSRPHIVRKTGYSLMAVGLFLHLRS